MKNSDPIEDFDFLLDPIEDFIPITSFQKTYGVENTDSAQLLNLLEPNPQQSIHKAEEILPPREKERLTQQFDDFFYSSAYLPHSYDELSFTSSSMENAIMSMQNLAFTDKTDLDSSSEKFLSEHESEDNSSILLENSRKIRKDTIDLSQSILSNATPQQKKYTHKVKRSYWDPEEDAQLLSLFSKYGPKWVKIASEMKDRTRKQIRDRYMNMLKPDINHTPWTEEEDKKLIFLIEEFGNKWKKIAEYLPGRTEGQVKNKYYWHQRNEPLRQSTFQETIESLLSKDFINPDSKKVDSKNPLLDKERKMIAEGTKKDLEEVKDPNLGQSLVEEILSLGKSERKRNQNRREIVEEWD